MNQHATASKDPDILASVKALRRAARRALDLGLRTGTPVYVMKGGAIVDLTKEGADAVGKYAAVTGRGTLIAYTWQSPKKAPQSDRADPFSRQGPNTI